jgi:hypothetical protein
MIFGLLQFVDHMGFHFTLWINISLVLLVLIPFKNRIKGMVIELNIKIVQPLPWLPNTLGNENPRTTGAILNLTAPRFELVWV